MLAAPDAATRIGRRDRALLLLAMQTGLRVSALTHLRCDQVILGAGAHVRCDGKAASNAPRHFVGTPLP